MAHLGSFLSGLWFFGGGYLGLLYFDRLEFLIPIAIGAGCFIRAALGFMRDKRAERNYSSLEMHKNELFRLVSENVTIDEVAQLFSEKYNIYQIDTIKFAAVICITLSSSDDQDLQMLGIAFQLALYSGEPKHPFDDIKSFDTKKTIMFIDETVISRPSNKSKLYRVEGTFILTKYYLYFFSNYRGFAKEITCALAGDVPIVGKFYDVGAEITNAISKEGDKLYSKSQSNKRVKKLQNDRYSLVIPLNSIIEIKPHILLGLKSVGEKASIYIKWKDYFSNVHREYLFGTSTEDNDWSVDLKSRIDLAVVSQGMSEDKFKKAMTAAEDP